MAESDGKGSDKAVAKRATKFRLPDRASRPSDETYFDYVLSAIETDEAKDEIAPPEETKLLQIELPKVIPEKSLLIKKRYVEGNAPSDAASAESASTLDSDAELLEVMPPESLSDIGSAPSPTTPDEDTPFEVFKKRWAHFLTETLVNLCEIIHNNTIAQNREYYDTTARELCQAVGRSRRHTFLLLSQLENMGFVTRNEIRESNRLVGVRIWFHLSPLQK